MKEYLLCLDRQYNIELGENNNVVFSNLEQMLDNLIYLLQTYGVDDDEILYEIKQDTSINVKEND